MKHILLSFLLFLPLSGVCQSPKWVKKARRAQVSLLVYDAQDHMRQGQGFFLSDAGTVVTDYDLLKGATRVTVATTDNKTYAALRLAGGSSLYNVATLTTDAKAYTLDVAPSAPLKGDVVYVLPVPTDKDGTARRDTITAIEPFGTGYAYYKLSGEADERLTGAPVLTEDGTLIGMAQKSGEGLYAVSLNYAQSLTIGALDANNADYHDIAMPLSLPAAEDQATSFLFLTSRDTVRYALYVDDFIARFPQSSTGYVLKAEAQAARGAYDEAEQTYAEGLKAGTKKDDELHYSLAKMLYAKGLAGDTLALPRALDEARQANTLAPNPLYTAMEGFALYALKQYGEAYTRFEGLGTTNMRSAEYWFYAAQCKEKLGAEKTEILALQDSAVAMFSKPYPREAANYLLLRAQTLKEMERYREAVADYNEYEHLMIKVLTGNFYYEREQLELRCRMYEQALSDINHAVTLASSEPLFRAEQAAVNYRLGRFDEAILACQEAVRLDARFGDAYRIWGMCLVQTGDKAGARAKLQQAIDCGDEIAKQLIDDVK